MLAVSVLSLSVATAQENPVADSGQGSEEVAKLLDEYDRVFQSLTKETPLDEFKSMVLKQVELVDQMIKIAPDDPRTRKLMLERWGHLRVLARQSASTDHHAALNRLQAELDQYCQTAADPALKNAAANFSASLRLDEQHDGPTSAAIVEEHARQWPEDAQAPRLYERAIARLHQSRMIRLELGAAFLLFAFALLILLKLQQQDWFKQRQTAMDYTLLALAIVGILVVTIFSSKYFPLQVFGSGRIRHQIELVRQNGFALISSARFAIMLVAASGAAVMSYLLTPQKVSVRRSSSVIKSLGLFVTILGFALVVDAYLIAQQTTGLEQHLIKNYPDSPRARREQSRIRREQAVGKPFELDFTDVISGRDVSISALRGKVVVIDFWATWCGPCRHEIPEMKRLYAKYHAQGVEFIGISQDLPVQDGGLDALKKFVAEQEIPWPQYYFDDDGSEEANTARSKNPSVVWGVNEIPTVFLVDQQGDLYSTTARGELDQLIPRLLQKNR